MVAFHNDINIKNKYLSRVSAHEKADEIVKGKYWEHGKGCAVGCTIHSADHAAYETELGIPRIIARLEDSIFENIPDELAKTWPRRFLEAIKPGADLALVWSEFAVWMLRDDEWGVIRFLKTNEQRDALNSVADLYQLQIEGVTVSRDDWSECRDAADAAYAADVAADAAAYAAADDAASVAYDADAADAAAATYAAAYAMKTKWRIAQSEKLLELLKSAPVAGKRK